MYRDSSTWQHCWTQNVACFGHPVFQTWPNSTWHVKTLDILQQVTTAWPNRTLCPTVFPYVVQMLWLFGWGLKQARQVSTKRWALSLVSRSPRINGKKKILKSSELSMVPIQAHSLSSRRVAKFLWLHRKCSICLQKIKHRISWNIK